MFSAMGSGMNTINEKMKLRRLEQKYAKAAKKRLKERKEQEKLERLRQQAEQDEENIRQQAEQDKEKKQPKTEIDAAQTDAEQAEQAEQLRQQNEENIRKQQTEAEQLRQQNEENIREQQSEQNKENIREPQTEAEQTQIDVAQKEPNKEKKQDITEQNEPQKEDQGISGVSGGPQIITKPKESKPVITEPKQVITKPQKIGLKPKAPPKIPIKPINIDKIADTEIIKIEYKTQKIIYKGRHRSIIPYNHIQSMSLGQICSIFHLFADKKHKINKFINGQIKYLQNMTKVDLTDKDNLKYIKYLNILAANYCAFLLKQLGYKDRKTINNVALRYFWFPELRNIGIYIFQQDCNDYSKSGHNCNLQTHNIANFPQNTQDSNGLSNLIYNVFIPKMQNIGEYYIQNRLSENTLKTVIIGQDLNTNNEIFFTDIIAQYNNQDHQNVKDAISIVNDFYSIIDIIVKIVLGRVYAEKIIYDIRGRYFLVFLLFIKKQAEHNDNAYTNAKFLDYISNLKKTF